MSTVCYCGQPDCPVTTWEHDACVANLRAERDALKAEVDLDLKPALGLLKAVCERLEAERDALKAQVANLEAELAQGVEACRAHVCLGAQEAKAERDELAAALRLVRDDDGTPSAEELRARQERARAILARAALTRPRSLLHMRVIAQARAVLAKYPEGR